jgi:hypothetical protein
MLSSEEIKSIAINLGADKCGITSTGRFSMLTISLSFVFRRIPRVVFCSWGPGWASEGYGWISYTYIKS